VQGCRFAFRLPPCRKFFYKSHWPWINSTVHVLIAISHSRARASTVIRLTASVAVGSNRVASSNIRHSLYPRGAYQSFY
jgi:hypothetical protein